MWAVTVCVRTPRLGRCGDPCWLTLSIHLPHCQGGSPPSNLSSRPERSVAEGSAVSLSGTANVPWANRPGFRFSMNANCRSLRYPGFLSRLVALASFMRLSSLKAAHAAVGECRAAGNPGALRSRDDKFEGSGPPWHGWRGMDRTGATATNINGANTLKPSERLQLAEISAGTRTRWQRSGAARRPGMRVCKKTDPPGNLPRR